MTAFEQDQLALQRCCCNDPLAMDWLGRVWREYVHAVDDDDDEPNRTPVDRCRTHALAIEVFNHPFYIAHREQLLPLIRATNNAYADSVQWEKSNVKWQADFADVYRHFASEIVLAVAEICGNERLNGQGYAHKRSISMELRTICHYEHHNQNGEPT